MMAIISDIHGNYPALKAVFADMQKFNCETIISLGDVVGYYCMVNECIELLRLHQVINIKGNHDIYLLENVPCLRSNIVNVCINYHKKIITNQNQKWLAKSIPFFKNAELSMVHAGWNDPVDEYLQNISPNYFTDREGKYFFSGHTHVQFMHQFGDKVYCNPGSVGQPRDGDWRAAYAIYDKGKIILRRVEYSVQEIAVAMDKAGFASFYYENLYKGTRISGKLSSISIAESL